MKRSVYLILSLLLVLLAVFSMTACVETAGESSEPAGEPVTISVSAAASLTNVLNDIANEYVKECDDTIEFNFGGSGALRTQIEEGAPCDLFLSAATNHMDTLEGAGLIVTDSRTDLLSNTLTLIASKEKAGVITLASFSSDAVESIAVCEPNLSPAGQYTMQTFDYLGITNAVASKIVYAQDVKAVLDYVDTGNVDCGFVFMTDALLLKTGVIVADVPTETHDAILYPAALIRDTAHPEAAAAFLEYLGSDTAKAIFEEYCFTVL